MYRYLTIIGALLATPAAAEGLQFDDFAIDRIEVTVKAFAAFADRASLVTAAEQEGGGFEWGAGWERRAGWTFRTPYGARAADDEPAVHVRWEEAQAFCEDAGGRLPTRDQWALAAYTERRAAPTDGFETGRTYAYPVGDKPDGMISDKKRHASAGTSKRGVNGLYDMGGNVWEWLADRREDQALTAGGSWWYGPNKARLDGMQWKLANFYAVYVGFRCACEGGD